MLWKGRKTELSPLVAGAPDQMSSQEGVGLSDVIVGQGGRKEKWMDVGEDESEERFRDMLRCGKYGRVRRSR